MTYHVLTLFPDMIEQVACTSILGRARDAGYIDFDLINIRDFSTKKTLRVDDYPYGGGAGMVMEPEPVYQAIKKARESSKGKAKVIYLTPQGEVLSQVKAEELAKEEDLILLCGHYEGIDERVLEEEVDEYISIGDYVLTGGELGACVVIDAVSRFVPGVLSNKESSQFESLQDNLLEYPQYTRPEVWHDMAVPEVLLSGDHKKVEEWRHEQSLIRTKTRRPDLLKKSYKVKVAYYGEELEEFAASFGEAVSRYSEILNYNRAKLHKVKRRCGKSDLVIVVVNNYNNIDVVFDKMSGHETKLIIVSKEELNDEVNDFFESRGFSLVQFIIADDKGFDISKAAIGIRKVLNNS